jgi:drug/metabolite transporter (DMT)-like permease
VAPLEYTGIVWAALLGHALFGEVPRATTALSAGLIVGGCLLLLRR